MGMVINGQYFKEVDMAKLKSKQQSTYKLHDHNRQRKDFSREIVQPYDRNGKLSQDFIDAYPKEAKELYGQSQAS